MLATSRIREIVQEADRIPGWMTETELRTLTQLASRLPPGASWLELGVWCGRSACAVGLSLPPDSRFDLIDPFTDFIPYYHAFMPNSRWPRDEFGKTLQRIRGCRPDLMVNVWEYTSETASKLVSGQFDVVFVDADHSFDNVTRDCRLWQPRIKPNGILCGHDYSNEAGPEVVRAIDELYRDRISVFVGTSIWQVVMGARDNNA